MNNIILKYILYNFIKSLLIVVLVIFCFGIILNLFEEIEFFKNLNVDIFKPLILTSLFVPSLILKLLPFIIFLSSMWFIIKIRENNDFLILKVYGFSNLKIFFILAITSFLIGCIVVTIISPITSTMVKYYEITKSQYARDIDHLVTFNQNGLWIKEPIKDGNRIISAVSINGSQIKNTTIFEFDNDQKLKKKIFAESINISEKKWKLTDVKVFSFSNQILEKKTFDQLEIVSMYDLEKITSLFSNSDTISFLDLFLNYQTFLDNGYNKQFLDQSFHTMLSLPFLLFLMTSIATILTMHTNKRTDNFRYIIVGLITCVIVYYLKDLLIALGKTDRIPIILSIWAPVLTLSFFTLIGVVQINEK